MVKVETLKDFFKDRYPVHGCITFPNTFRPQAFLNGVAPVTIAEWITIPDEASNTYRHIVKYVTEDNRTHITDKLDTLFMSRTPAGKLLFRK